MSHITFRTAIQDDAAAVAALHADSWQRHYRGAYTDTFLDDEAPGYLATMWTDRLTTPSSKACTILAEHGHELVGLAHTFLDADPTWGALLDNLHVRHGLKRQGLGTRLLTETARAVRDRSSSGLYLWVLEQNTAAQAFYSATGGTLAGRDDVPAPGGNSAWLNGRPTCLRYTWPDPATLL